jgi:carboxymethylenebutenolidase
MNRNRRGAISTSIISLLALALGIAGVYAYVQASEVGQEPVHAEWVWIPSGDDSLRAYVALPDRESEAPGLIIIHENRGLTAWEPTVANRLAASGYVAVAVDLLSRPFGITPTNQDSARVLIGQLDPDGVTADLDATYTWLSARPDVDDDVIGVIGFCWGGGQSFRYATNNDRLHAVVVCYGPAPDTADLARIRAPILGVYGEDDNRINSQLPVVEDQMRRLGKRFVAETYDGTGHGFLKPGRQGSDGPEVERAWTRIVNFYRETLGR